MNDFVWNNTLSVGVDEMDKQHQVLIGYINNLVNEIEVKGDILKSFDILSAYVVKHFQDEEKLMEANNYSGIASHKIIHQRLLSSVGEYRDQISDKTLQSDKLISFLKMWLTSHIKGIDTKYGQEFGNLKKAS